MILGTANFGQEYGGKPGLDKSTAFKLLDMALEAGWGVETSTEYGPAYSWCQEWHKQPPIILCKTGRGSKVPMFWVDDNGSGEGLSVYDLEEGLSTVIEAPLSVLNQTWAPYVFLHDFYARSVFARGLVFDHPPLLQLSSGSGYSITELCLGFVDSLSPRGIVVGIDSTAQLDQCRKSIPSLPPDVLAGLRQLDLRLDLRAKREILPV